MPKVLLNSETAKQAGIRSGEVRRERSLRSVPVPVQQALNTLEWEFVQNTLAQLRRCDRLLSQCREPDLFLKLTSAKERLHGLIFHRPGVRKPGRGGPRRTLPVATDSWQTIATPPQEQPLPTPAPEPTPATVSRSMIAPVIPAPTPGAPDSQPPPRVLEALPQPEPQQSVPGSVPPPQVSVRVPPAMFELTGALSLLFKRSAGQPWTTAEEAALLAVAQRRNVATEIEVMRNCHRRLAPMKRSPVPPTALALLENWDKVLAFALRHLPR